MSIDKVCEFELRLREYPGVDSLGLHESHVTMRDVVKLSG